MNGTRFWQTVTSSAIVRMGYSYADSCLYVEFSNSNYAYRYEAVPESLFNSLLLEQSIGTAFGNRVRGNYQSSRCDVSPFLGSGMINGMPKEEIDFVTEWVW